MSWLIVCATEKKITRNSVSHVVIRQFCPSLATIFGTCVENCNLISYFYYLKYERNGCCCCWCVTQQQKIDSDLHAWKMYNFSNGRFICYTIWCVSCFIYYPILVKKKSSIWMNLPKKGKMKQFESGYVIHEIKHKRKKYTQSGSWKIQWRFYVNDCD